MSNIEQSRTTSITLEDGDTEDLLVTPIGSDLYRLEESSLFGELRYHDVIEAEALTDGGLRFVRVAAASESRTLSWILPEDVFDNPTLKALLVRVMSIGGNWERTLGGVLTLHLPHNHELSIKCDMQDFFSTLPGQSTSVGDT